jgi:pyruvate dehydrogenase E2 component (dihydrolipoamide acetyltransferase)
MLQTRADVTELIALVDRLNASGEMKIAMFDFIVKASTLGLSANPSLGVKTDRLLSLKETAHARHEREAGGQAGKLRVVELGGGAFSVVDLGDYGITGFTPPLTQSHAAVLGVGAAEETLRLIGGQVAARRTMAVSLAHNLGAAATLPAAALLRRIRMLLENPAVLLA